MRIFKKIDLVVQIILLIVWVFVLTLDLQLLFYTYFLVGGWQLLSCMIHLLGDFYPVAARKSYLWTLVTVFILGLISVVFYFIHIPVMVLYLGLLLIISPMLALWYAYICYKEVKLYQQKEWIQLR